MLSYDKMTALSVGSQDQLDGMASLARCHLKVGISKIYNRQDSDTGNLEEAIRLYDLLATFEGRKGYPDIAIRGRRGQACLHLWYATKRDPKLLDHTIEDLQAAHNEDSPSLWQHALANALLERYDLLKDSEDISDLQKAKDLNDQKHTNNMEESHLKQRGRIYSKWAKTCSSEEVEGAYDIALESFRNCLSSEDPEIQYYVGLVLANRGIQFGYEDDLREAIKWLETKLDLPYNEESKIGILPKIYRELAMKIHKRQLEEALSLLDKAIAILQKKLSASEPPSNQELAEYHSLMGSTYHDRYKISGLPGDIVYARKHLQQAYDLGMRDPMLLGRLGHVCLQRGKISGSLFSMDPKLEVELDKGIIPEELKGGLKIKAFSLSKRSTITKESMAEWVITDEETKDTYIIRKVKTTGKVYKLNIYITEDIEEQRGFFEDSRKYLKASKEKGNEDISLYSELGEACFRLYQIRKDKSVLKEALNMFLESHNRGNDSPENLGLIGDCYYSLSHFEISEENLFKALEFKAKARKAGHESKEHFSLVGRINLSLFKELGNHDYFINGVKFVCEAGWKDKKWPWPVCQLAEAAEQFPEMVEQLKSGQIEESFSYPDSKVWQCFLEKQPKILWFEGAKLVANWPEIKEKILGGKSKVYIAEDPHGLISTTYVFKPGDSLKRRLPDRGLQRLSEEQERTVKMNQYLEQIGAEKFLVPTPIGIFPIDEAKIYAMRRSTGRNLSDLILYGPHRYCEEAIQNTIKFLALYHAWHPVPQENKEQIVVESRNRLNKLKRVIMDNGLPMRLGDKIINITEPIFEIMRQLPLVEKRDAHPDNWIVTNEGKIIMIDLEKPKPQSQFILSELVQLIEDYPYLPWNQEGWQKRKALIKEYLEHYNSFLELKSISPVSISPELQVACYLSFTIWRALWGIGFAFGKEHREGISSSSELQWEKRKEHYFNLITAVPPIWTEENIPFAAPNWEQLLTFVEGIREALSTLK